MIDVGDPLPDLGVLVYDSAGALAAASTVVLTLTKPDGTSTTPTVTSAATGIYSATYTTTLPGRHIGRWVVTTITGGAAQETYEQTWDVTSNASLIVGLDDVKTFLRITGSADDEQLRDILEAAADLCERYTRKVWRRTTVTEIHHGGVDVIYLRRPPVVSITSVNDTGTVLAATSYTVDLPTGRLFYGDTTYLGWWTPGQDNITVTYITGPPSGIVPGYIRRGVLILVEHLWATQRGGSNLPRLAGGSDEYDRRVSFTLPRRVMEMWGEPAPLVR